MKKPRVLCLLNHYLPGNKSGGPVRSVANIVTHLANEIDFAIITSDRDLGDSTPYPSIKQNAWNNTEGAEVFYADPELLTFAALRKLIVHTPHNILYLNSLFNPKFTLYPLLSHSFKGASHCAPILLAPRGELSVGALQLKAWKKRSALRGLKLSGVLRTISWQASSPSEANDIRRNIGPESRIFIAPNLPTATQPLVTSLQSKLRQKLNPLRVVFLSRISPMKNLEFALHTLFQVGTPVHFSIYGPNPEKAYWNMCQALISKAPPHIKVTYEGTAEPDKTHRILQSHDLFFLPTLGENYGHAISEALSVGTPVLIANTTPWVNLEADGLGWELPLSDQDAFVAAIENVARLTPAEHDDWRSRIRVRALKRMNVERALQLNRKMFFEIIEQKERGT